MNEDEGNRSLCPGELRLLVFTAGGNKIGVDTAQITEIIDGEEAESRGWKPRFFSGTTRSEPGGKRPVKVLVTRTEQPSGTIAIDTLEDIVTVPLGEIKPLPSLIRSSSRSRGIWGAVIRSEEIILLLDLDKLPPLESTAA